MKKTIKGEETGTLKLVGFLVSELVVGPGGHDNMHVINIFLQFFYRGPPI